MKINILGTDYKIITKNYDEEPSFEERDIYSYCDGYAKEIVMCSPHTHPASKGDEMKTLIPYHKCMLRHEIVHAFLFESGLAQETFNNDAWATNEEMIDWVARQGTKIYHAWEKASAI